MSISRPSPDLLPESALLIGTDRAREASGGEHRHVYAATGMPTARVPLAGAPEMAQAVEAARQALAPWRAMPANLTPQAAVNAGLAKRGWQRIIQVKLATLPKILRVHDQPAIVARPDSHPGIESDGGRHHKSVVVVGMFTDQIHSTWRAVDVGRRRAIELVEFLFKLSNWVHPVTNTRFFRA